VPGGWARDQTQMIFIVHGTEPNPVGGRRRCC